MNIIACCSPMEKAREHGLIIINYDSNKPEYFVIHPLRVIKGNQVEKYAIGYVSKTCFYCGDKIKAVVNNTIIDT